MKALGLFFIVCLTVAGFMSGCEKNDYQHPMHRSTQG